MFLFYTLIGTGIVIALIAVVVNLRGARPVAELVDAQEQIRTLSIR